MKSFKFFPEDFYSGTLLLTDEEVGKYIRVLCVMWSNGPMTPLQVENLFGALPENVLRKLVVNQDDGRLYSPRLEVERRKAKPIKGRKQSPTAPTVDDVRKYALDLVSRKGYENASHHCGAFFDYFESNGWKVGRNPMKDWKAAFRNWVRRDRPVKVSDESERGGF